MTQKLIALFDLPDNTADIDPSESPIIDPATLPSVPDLRAALQEVDTAIDKIDAALPMVTDLDTSDADLDELALLAKDKFNDLVDLAMNVEPRLSGQILQSAVVLLGHSITAKQAKLDKKLRMIELQIRKARLDQTAPASKDTEEDSPIEGHAVAYDRNTLLREILASRPPVETIKP